MRKKALGICLLLVIMQGATVQGTAWGSSRSFGAGIKFISTKLKTKSALALCSLKHKINGRQLQRFTINSLNQVLKDDLTLKRTFKESRARYLNRKKLFFNQFTSSGLIAGPLTYLAGAQIAHQPLGKALMVAGGARFIWGFIGARVWHRMVREASKMAYQEVFPKAVKVNVEGESVLTSKLPARAPSE